MYYSSFKYIREIFRQENREENGQIFKKERKRKKEEKDGKSEILHTGCLRSPGPFYIVIVTIYISGQDSRIFQI